MESLIKSVNPKSKQKYRITAYQNIACAHQLTLSYDSPCNRVHGHNYGVWVTITGAELNSEGMIVDFSKIKSIVREYDHNNLNKLMSPDDQTQFMNPTAENLAREIYFRVKRLFMTDDYKIIIRISETENNIAEFGDLDDKE